ncbi:halocarboxylic acid dehydrogenase DehI family protein [Metabacillus endolithicus]|uniref:Halocarboxylic acid dehydrogenase DehI family protein n=1 Tax=Metabacillus endolithicus TaxID=1535204 RepID=A0ABW5BW37_9BACI|nr:halocarboxylic acid dehydrogenase DehI family protein [Metabacillus endolithicus]UPG63079.1 halocarboxylic acid dehydrogenase DehI family protein [Metabacillus endolithicus]
MKSDKYGVPEIFEENVKGNLSYLYQDIQYVLKVPIVNFIFRTTALYEAFLQLAWSQVRPSMLTSNMENAASEIRNPKLGVDMPTINWSNHYDQATIEKIKKIIFTFNYVNSKLLIIASAWSESLSNRTIHGGNQISGYIQPGILPGLPKINLIKIESAPKEVKGLLLDIAKTHHTYDVASDYRALGRYPVFLRKSWSHLKEYIGTDSYQLLSTQLKKQSINLAHQMPFPVTINRSLLSQCYSPKDIAGIMGVISMFQQFLPPLIIDGEFFRMMLTGKELDGK